MKKFTDEQIRNAWLDVHMVLGFRIWNHVEDMEKQDNPKNKFHEMTKSLIEEYRSTSNEEEGVFMIGNQNVKFIDLYDGNSELYDHVIMESYFNDYNKKFNLEESLVN
jgi:hypothetical protein